MLHAQNIFMMYTFIRKYRGTSFVLTLIVISRGDRVTASQKVINLSQLFDDRCKRKVFREFLLSTIGD